MENDSAGIDKATVTLSPSEPFAQYIARLLVAREGYFVGTVPEAGVLLTLSDIVLTIAENMYFSVICIIDAVTDLNRRFVLEDSALLEIAAACRKRHAHAINSDEEPLLFEIIEVRQTVSTADIERLKQLKSHQMLKVTACAVDISRSKVTSFLSPHRHLLEKALRNPRIPVEEL